jgi:hypothetical protein
VIIGEGIWPDHAFAGGIGFNILTGAEPGLPVARCFYDTSMWLRAA